MNITRRRNPLLTRGFAFCFAKQGGKILCSCKDSRILLRKTRRLNPLLTRGFAFSYGKQGGYYV